MKKIVSLMTYDNPIFEDDFIEKAVHAIDCIMFVGDRLDYSIEECEKMKYMLQKWNDRLDSNIKYIEANSIDTMKG